MGKAEKVFMSRIMTAIDQFPEERALEPDSVTVLVSQPLDSREFSSWLVLTGASEFALRSPMPHIAPPFESHLHLPTTGANATTAFLSSSLIVHFYRTRIVSAL